MSSKIKSFPTYALSLGFSNSRRHSVKFRRLLEQAGYQEAKNLAGADIIIALSAGCYRIPAHVKAKLILLIGIPMNKDKLSQTFRAATKQNYATFRETGNLGLLTSIFFLGSVDVILHPLKNYQLVKTVKESRHALPATFAAQTTVISGRDDIWPEPVKELAAVSEHGYGFLSLQGSHDHIWQAPEQYVEIINAYATRLLA
jgi:hypothetical protein